MDMNTPSTIALNPRQSREQNRAFIQECPLSRYDELTRAQRLTDLARRINASTDDDEQRRLKSYLPFRCPHYTRFRNNYRDREHIDPESFTFQTCIDIDDPALVERANALSDKLNAEEDGRWQGMMLHKDYSIRRKLHIDIRLPLGMTVPEAQRDYCQALGVEADTSCFTPERFIYLSPADFEIYRAEGWYAPLPADEVARRQQAYLDRGLTIDGRTPTGLFHDPEDPKDFKDTNAAKGDGSAAQGERRFPTSFKGIPYSDIIDEYWRRTGGVPAEGERNKRLHQLAANLRAVCDNSEEWLLEVMPACGLSAQEMHAIVHSACKEPTKGSRLMDEIVSQLSAELKADDTEEADANRGAKPYTLSAKMRNSLPMGLKESLVGVPAAMHLPVLCSVLPIAAAYADQVEVEYCDGNRQRLGLMSIIQGEQASGKSVCKFAVDLWKRQFDEEDALARRREDEWKERRKSRKANEKAPDDPHVLIRTVPVTVSCSTLLKRLKNARGHCLYSFGEELDTLRKTNGAGSWAQKWDIYRVGFDGSEWGQDYNSDAAESGVVKVAYNWTMLGTLGALRKCFKAENIENGLSSRVLVAEMPDTAFARMPKYVQRSAEDEARIQEAVTRLRACSGLVDVPKLREAIEEWVEAKRVEAAKDIDHVKDTYRKRAAVIGFRCGVVHHLLKNTTCETKATIDFALMMAEYCLMMQMKVFGEALQSQYVEASDLCQRYTANHSVFDQLGTMFTLDDLRTLKRGLCSEASLRKIVSRWSRDGWIEKADAKHWRKAKNVTL